MSIVDGFERESSVLVEYVNNLESKLQQQKDDFKRKEAQLLSERKAIEQKMELALQHAKLEKSRLQQENDKFVNESDTTIHSLRNNLDSSSSSLRKERRKAQELENAVAELRQQMEHREQHHNRRKARDQKERTKLDDELHALQKKVNLGWIMGSLQEVYLRSDKGGDQSDKGGDQDAQNIQFNDTMDSLEKKVQSLIDRVVQSPNAADGDDNDGWDSDRDSENGRAEEPDATNRKSAEQKVRDSQQIRRPRSLPPPVAHRARKPRATEDASSSGRGTSAIFDDQLKADIEITSETCTQRLKSNKCQPRTRSVPRTISSQPQTAVHSQKSPRCKTINSSPSRAASPRSPKKSSATDAPSERAGNGSVNSPTNSPKKKELSRSEMFRRQRDIQKLICSVESSLNSMLDSEKKKRT